MKQFHRLNALCISTLAPAKVVALLVTLNADSYGQVAEFLHFKAERLVNKSCVCIAEEHAVGILSAESDNIILANERLAAGKHIDVCSESCTLADDTSHFVKSEI